MPDTEATVTVDIANTPASPYQLDTCRQNHRIMFIVGVRPILVLLLETNKKNKIIKRKGTTCSVMASYRKPRNVRLTTCLAPTLFVSMCLLSYWYGSIVPASISMVLRLPLAYAAYVRHQQTFYLTTKWVLRVTHNDSVPVPTK